jgi:hypothetical protein
MGKDRACRVRYVLADLARDDTRIVESLGWVAIAYIMAKARRPHHALGMLAGDLVEHGIAPERRQPLTLPGGGDHARESGCRVRILPGGRLSRRAEMRR